MSVYPAWAAGTRISADKLTAGQTILVQKSADETLASSTTMQDDDELFVPVAVNASYVVDAWIFAYQGLSSATAIDIKTEWSGPAGAGGLKWCVGPQLGMTDRDNTSMACAVHGFSTDRVYGLGDASNGVTIHEHLLVNTVGVAGTVQFRWAQNTSNANGTTVGGLSHLIVTRLA